MLHLGPWLNKTLPVVIFQDRRAIPQLGRDGVLMGEGIDLLNSAAKITHAVQTIEILKSKSVKVSVSTGKPE